MRPNNLASILIVVLLLMDFHIGFESQMHIEDIPLLDILNKESL